MASITTINLAQQAKVALPKKKSLATLDYLQKVLDKKYDILIITTPVRAASGKKYTVDLFIGSQQMMSVPIVSDTRYKAFDRGLQEAFKAIIEGTAVPTTQL